MEAPTVDLPGAPNPRASSVELTDADLVGDEKPEQGSFGTTAPIGTPAAEAGRGSSGTNGVPGPPIGARKRTATLLGIQAPIEVAAAKLRRELTSVPPPGNVSLSSLGHGLERRRGHRDRQTARRRQAHDGHRRRRLPKPVYGRRAGQQKAKTSVFWPNSVASFGETRSGRTLPRWPRGRSRFGTRSSVVASRSLRAAPSPRRHHPVGRRRSIPRR